VVCEIAEIEGMRVEGVHHGMSDITIELIQHSIDMCESLSIWAWFCLLSQLHVKPKWPEEVSFGQPSNTRNESVIRTKVDSCLAHEALGHSEGKIWISEKCVLQIVKVEELEL
jgi:hypothetical protein